MRLKSGLFPRSGVKFRAKISGVFHRLRRILYCLRSSPHAIHLLLITPESLKYLLAKFSGGCPLHCGSNDLAGHAENRANQRHDPPILTQMMIFVSFVVCWLNITASFVIIITMIVTNLIIQGGTNEISR